MCDCAYKDDEEEKEQSVEMELKTAWLGLSPPAEESNIMGKWYAGIYDTKDCSKLFIVRLLKRFFMRKWKS